MKRFKVGDVVFCTKDYANCSAMLSGDVGVIKKNFAEKSWDVASKRGPYHDIMAETVWIISESQMMIYNKKNWCRVFIEFMESQK